MKMMIVTGVTGFVGKYFVRELLTHGYQVCGVVRNAQKIDPQLLAYPSFTYIVSPLEELTPELFPMKRVSGFFHFAWGGVNREEIDNPHVHERNYDNSVRCLETAKALGCNCFLDAGSRMEYGRTDGFMDESIEPHPDTAYGIWKEEFYRYALAAAKGTSMVYIHIRIFSVIGVGDHPWSITATACRKLSAGESMTFGPCTQLWNFMAVEDAAKAIRLLFENRERMASDDNHIVNVANYDTRVLRSFIEEIYQITGSTSKLIFRDGDPGTSTYAVVEKLQRITDWKSEIPYFVAIRNILAHQQEFQSEL